MRAALVALILMIGSQAGAECGKLCDKGWWESAAETDLKAELDAGAEVMARTKNGTTPLHRADTPANIQALLDAGADGKAKDKDGKSPWDLAQKNKKLEGTKGYWALNDAQYN